MSTRFWISPALVLLGALAATSLSAAEKAKDTKPAAAPEFKLPPGWTEEDMKACMVAGTPGEMHKLLVDGAGKWTGKSTMWMTPGSEPITTDCNATVTSIMDGRYIKYEFESEMPGMGPYHGFGLYGYDNVAKAFKSTWIDNHSTGMMVGDGELSKDGKTLTWNFKFHCPVTGKPAAMREVETITGPNTRTLEMFGADPKSGKEFKMMSIALTRK